MKEGTLRQRQGEGVSSRWGCRTASWLLAHLPMYIKLKWETLRKRKNLRITTLSGRVCGKVDGKLFLSEIVRQRLMRPINSKLKNFAKSRREGSQQGKTTYEMGKWDITVNLSYPCCLSETDRVTWRLLLYTKPASFAGCLLLPLRHAVWGKHPNFPYSRYDFEWQQCD